MANSQDGHPDPGIQRILEELRDLRIEMREDRRRADEDRRRADEDRNRSDERFERTLRETSQETREHIDRVLRETSRETREHIDRALHDFREDSARREAATQKVIKDTIKELRTDMRGVGLAIVKSLNRNTQLLEHISTHHGRLLERIDRKLGARDNGRPGRGNGRGN